MQILPPPKKLKRKKDAPKTGHGWIKQVLDENVTHTYIYACSIGLKMYVLRASLPTRILAFSD